MENSYGARLRKIARHIGDIVTGFDLSTPQGAVFIGSALRRYADMLDPWARSVGARMVAEVAAADKLGWRRLSTVMGRALHREIEEAPTGQAMRASMERQVTLIKSLPLDAAERVHRLTVEGISQGRRADEIARDIMATGEVTKSRATLIARTEVSRTATELTKARAEYVGSTEFIWRTAGDGDVRDSHKRLNGKVFRWDAPPECDPGHHALPGGIWNCRCYPEAVIPD
ncbi:phage head morphogenesis protein [Methylobacterium sp. WL19]|nr:phage head morphogenesis protein [Methylobacterium sp. WL19]